MALTITRYVFIFMRSFMFCTAQYFILIASVLLLFACGGGSSADAPPSTTAPIVVNAGENISLNETDSVNIAGGSSGGAGAITYSYTADSSVTITHDDTTLTSAQITAPVVTAITEYDITLTATDESGNSASDSFVLTVNPVNILPVASISANQIDNYAANNYPVTSTVVLDGQNSSDEDPQTSDAPISAYMWQQISGPSVLAGVNTSESSLNFNVPALSSLASAIFRLTVTDQENASTSADISINLLPQSDTIPEVAVIAARDVFSGEIVTLSGTAQSLSADAAPFTPTWSNDAGASINNAGAFITFATTPVVQTDTAVNYVLSIEDSFRNTASTQISTTVYAPTTRYINDTGITQFANEQSVLATYQAEFAGQDAEYGADRQTLSGQVNKVGDGDQGFDFTRIDSNGDAVDNPSFAFDCVRDNVTGLVWQVKDNINANDIEYIDQKFTWFADDANGNVEGSLNESSSSCNVSNMQCNTQDYVAEINSVGMCGFFDWRLPSTNELQSIIHYGKTTPPLVDTVFLPYWGNNNSQPLWYWTNQSSADGVTDDLAQSAWAFDMNTGNDGILVKTSEQRVILVRAGR